MEGNNPLLAGAGTAPETSAAGASGQPVTAAPAGQPAEQAQQPQYLTKDEALKLMQDIATKTAQSFVDKSSSRIEQKIADIRAQVGTLTPDQEANLRATLAKSEAQTPQSPAADAPAQPAQAAQASPDNDPKLDAAWAMMKAANVAIEANDPEFKTININADPVEFFAQVQQAINAKAARLSSKENPNARTPLGGVTTPSANAPRSPREMLALGLKQNK